MVCERPSVIHRELVDPSRPRGWDSHRLHCATGPAIAWPDGWGVWAWHGVRVPRHVIEAPDTITVAEIQAEANAEVRRVLIERMGWDRWLSATGARPVQSDRFGDLYRIEVNDATVGVVLVNNSTPEPDGSIKTYALLVPAEHETAHAAVASTFGLTADEYQPVVET
jgi:hypothetical protein